MNNIEKISEVFASKISTKLSMDTDSEEVLAYGTFVLVQTFISIITVALFGLVFNVLIESLVISFAASILRKFSGGAHATTALNCTVIGAFIFGFLALLVKHLVMRTSFLFLVLLVVLAFTFAYYIMYRYCPVGTSTKPLKNENTRKRLKRKSIILLHILLIINIIIIYLQTKQIYLLNIAICISAGVVWQAFTMVSLGHKIIDVLDKALGDAINFIRGKNQ